MTIDPQLLAIASGVVIPLLVGLLTKTSASPGLKAVLNALLSALAGGVAIATQTSGHVDTRTWVFNIALAWVVSVSTYYGFHKPTGVAPAVQGLAPNFGLGAGQ